MRLRHHAPAIMAAALACTVVATPAPASSVVPMNIATMSDYAGQVVVADIGAVTSRWVENPRRIESVVTLERVEYLKGAYDGAPATFQLTVPGGQVGTIRMRVCCAPEFETGQRWVLFLLPTYKTYPTVGLGQGAFRIVTADDGSTSVLQHGSFPMTAINADGWPEYAVAPTRKADGCIVESSATIALRAIAAPDAPKRMTYEEFRNAIQSSLDASRDYQMTEPAGRRIVVTLQPTTLKTAKNVVSETGEATRSSQRNAAIKEQTTTDSGRTDVDQSTKQTVGKNNNRLDGDGTKGGRQ